MNLELLYRRWRSRIGPPRVDVPLLVALLLLIAAGLAVLYSAAGEQPRLVWSQGARMIAGLGALWLISREPLSIEFVAFATAVKVCRSCSTARL